MLTASSEASPLGGGVVAPPMPVWDTGPPEFQLSQVRVGPSDHHSVGRDTNPVLAGPIATGLVGDGPEAADGGGWSTVAYRQNEKRGVRNDTSQTGQRWNRKTYNQRGDEVQGRRVLSKGCFHCGKDGHIARNCPDILAGVFCVSCDSRGHYAQNCKNNRAKGKDGACFYVVTNDIEKGNTLEKRKILKKS